MDRRVRRRPLKAIKRDYLVRFGPTARLFNAVEVMLRGKVEATRASSGRQAKILECLAEAEPAGSRARLRLALRHKQRRLRRLQDRLVGVRARGVPGLCLGGRQEFQARFQLKENGYSGHGECLLRWVQPC